MLALGCWLQFDDVTLLGLVVIRAENQKLLDLIKKEEQRQTAEQQRRKQEAEQNTQNLEALEEKTKQYTVQNAQWLRNHTDATSERLQDVNK